ncbi:MAG: sugar kinase, partial [Spirochaetes bacterium]|nr:sugar kinase [Spirochaetota bacterium]
MGTGNFNITGGTIFLPYLSGERTPVWDPSARVVIFGLHSDTTQGDIVRAVLESSGYGLRQILEVIEAITGNIEAIPVAGGGAVSTVWMQLLADITGKRLYSRKITDSAATGAALLGGLAAGVYSDEYEASSIIDKKIVKEFLPDKANYQVYADSFGIYEQLYPS